MVNDLSKLEKGLVLLLHRTGSWEKNFTVLNENGNWCKPNRNSIKKKKSLAPKVLKEIE